MNVSRLEQIERLYQAAADRPADERVRFLDEECGGDVELRQEIESLLSYNAADASFLDSPPALLAAEMFSGDGRPTDLAGKQIGNYRIRNLLGVGGMGEVYLATDVRLNRPVALKVLAESIVDDPDRLMRFEREARAASALNHPNILTVHEFGESNGLHYLAAEFIDGTTLRQRMLAGQLKIEEALDIAIQAASALAAAHESGITHRDIKPENIMLRRDGYVKVVDFGLAKQRSQSFEPLDAGSEDPTHALLDTEPGVVMGTDAYMSPEQARGRQIDHRTDIWSLGVVIYELLAGQRPFAGETRADTITAILAYEPKPLSSLTNDLPAELHWVVSKALTKDVEGRYQTAKELQVDLKKIKRSFEQGEGLSEASGKSSMSADKGGSPQAHSTLETGVKTAEGNGKGTARNQGASGRLFSLAGSFISQGTGKAAPATVAAAILLLASVFGLAIYFGFAASRSAAQIDSIAVLPFENLTGDPNLTYVSDGLSEGLIDHLAEISQLKVISRRSSFNFRGSDSSLRDIAEQLGARAVVTGSVTQIGDELAVRIDIVDAVEDRHLAGGQLRRKAGELISVPNEMVQTVVNSISLKLSDDQSKRFTVVHTDNSEAFRYYLSGLVALNGPQDVRGPALEYFERAVQIDQNFAAAHAEIAWINWALANVSESPVESMSKVRASTERALAIDPKLAKGHVLRALLHEYEFDWQGAERAYRRAIELSPNSDFARNNFAFFLSIMGRHDDAFAELEEQRLRDPINKRLALLQKGILLTQARRFDEAIAVYADAQALDPAREIPQFSIGYAHAGKGSYTEAVEYYKRSVQLLGGEDKYSQPLVYLAATYAKVPGQGEEALKILDRIERMEGYRSPALMAFVYGALGDTDKAFSHLEQAYADRDILLRYIATGYEYDELRGDARFADLLRRTGLSK